MSPQPDLFGVAPRYPNRPGHKGRDTGEAAAEAVAPKTPKLQAEVLRVVEQRPVTPDECAAILGLSILTVRPRFSELAKLAKIVDSGARRSNGSGRKAIVWRRATRKDQEDG